MENLTNTLSWDIEQSKIYTNNKQVNGYKAIYRNDNQAILNIAKKSYTPASNELFMKMVEQLREMTGFELAGFSEYQGGRKTLGFLKNPDNIKIADWEAEDYLLVGNSHDYSTGFFVGTSNKLIRCSNAFSIISKQNVVQHTKSLKLRLDQLIAYYTAYIVEKQNVIDQFEEWNEIQMTSELKEMFLEKLLDIEDKKQCSTRKFNTLAEINIAIDREVNAMGNNLFGLFNGITFYTTHMLKQKESIFGNAMGRGFNLNQKAYNELQAITHF